MRRAEQSSKQQFSEIFCTNIGMAPSDYKYQIQGIPIYKNWCGPGHGGKVENVPPAVDDVDRACMHHDLCYDSRRFNDCNCDGRLIRELSGVSANGPEAEAARAAILTTFASIPCQCVKRVCLGVSVGTLPLFLAAAHARGDFYGRFEIGASWPRFSF